MDRLDFGLGLLVFGVWDLSLRPLRLCELGVNSFLGYKELDTRQVNAELAETQRAQRQVPNQKNQVHLQFLNLYFINLRALQLTAVIHVDRFPL